MAEDDFKARVTGYQANYYAPNFAGGTGDVDQPGQATPAQPSITEPNAGQPRPTTLLGQVHAQQDRAGGTGRRAGQLSDDDRAQIARRGYAPFNLENMKRLGMNTLGLMSGTGAITTGAASVLENATGEDPGSYGGIQNFQGYKGLTPDQVDQWGLPHPDQPSGEVGAPQNLLGGTQSAGVGEPRSLGGDTGGGGGEHSGNPGAQGANKSGSGDAAVQGGLYHGGGTVHPRRVGPPRKLIPPVRGGGDYSGRGAPAIGQLYKKGGTVTPRYGALPAHMQRRAEGGPILDVQEDDGQYTAPGSIPDDGVVDNQPAMLDGGEFVITREAAVAYDPEVLRAINDPARAPKIELLIADYLSQEANGADGAIAGQSQTIPRAMPTARPGMQATTPPGVQQALRPQLQPVPAAAPAADDGFRRGGTVRPRTRLGAVRAA